MNTQPRPKRAFVTAAGAGIGKACAERLAADGFHVVATDIDRQAIANLEGVAESGILDVTNPTAIEEFVSDQEAFDVVISVAGIVHHGTILDCSPEEWQRSIDVNLTSMYRVLRAVLPGMVANGGGALVTVASVASSIAGVKSRFAYGTTKAGVIGLTKSIAADFVERNIRANAICPGTIETPSLHGRMQATGNADEARSAFVARQPMGRLGKPEEVAALAAYLASDQAAFVTGTTSIIDGGWTN